METIVRETDMKNESGENMKIIIYNPNDEETFDKYFASVIFDTLKKIAD